MWQYQLKYILLHLFRTRWKKRISIQKYFFSVAEIQLKLTLIFTFKTALEFLPAKREKKLML